MKSELSEDHWIRELQQQKILLHRHKILLKQKIAELEQSELKYRSLYESLPDLCQTINTEGVILDCNKSYLDHLGYSKKEVIGVSFFAHIASDDVESTRNSFEEWKESGHVLNKEILMLKKDGTTFPAFLSATNRYDPDGTIIGSNTIIKDISEIQTLRQVDKAKEELSSMVTHEFNTPLVPILGNTEYLLHEDSKNLTEEQRETIQVIYDNTLSLSHLIQDLLDVQDFELNKIRLDVNDALVKDLIESCIENNKSLAETKNVNLVIKSEPELKLRCDAERILLVLNKLVRNAMKFVKKNEGRVEISARKDNDSVLFEVKDNGIGIPKEKRPNMFKKFYQVDMSSSRKDGGTGLELVICKGIVKAHNGKIWLDSKKGMGTTFYFSIPREKVNQ